MKNIRYLLFSIIIVLLLCVAMLSGCKSDLVVPNQGQTPNGPAIDGEDDPSQNQTTNDPTDGGNNNPPDSNQEQMPGNTESSDSSIMDGEDHVEMPFG